VDCDIDVLIDGGRYHETAVSAVVGRQIRSAAAK